MKKGILTVLVVAAAAVAGYLIFTQQNAAGPGGAASSSSSSAVSSVSASSAPSSAQEVSSAQEAPSSTAASEIPKEQAVTLVKQAISADWNKYAVKAASQTEQKTIDGKKYQTYLMWDEDYQVGPVILVDPGSGKVYTWAPADTAPVPASEDKAFDKTEHTFTGTVTDAAMMSVVVKTDDGRQLTVRRYGIDTSKLKVLKIGTKVKVTYTGVISGSDTSRAFVTKLESV